MFLAFVFWIGCKWIKKGGLCARGWENREPFFIDLLCVKQVLKTHKIPLVRWGALDWVGETTSAKRSYFFIIYLLLIINEMKQTAALMLGILGYRLFSVQA